MKCHYKCQVGKNIKTPMVYFMLPVWHLPDTTLVCLTWNIQQPRN